MWIRFEGHLLHRDDFVAFFIKRKKIIGVDKHGKIHHIKKYESIEVLRHAMNILGKKIGSE